MFTTLIVPISASYYSELCEYIKVLLKSSMLY